MRNSRLLCRYVLHMRVGVVFVELLQFQQQFEQFELLEVQFVIFQLQLEVLFFILVLLFLVLLPLPVLPLGLLLHDPGERFHL